MQREITEQAKLLDSQGNIATPGYSKTYLLQYDRKEIQASSFRIKEWDYYYINAGDKALCLTVADMGYVGAVSVSYLDFSLPYHLTRTAICLLPMGKFNMPSTPATGDVVVKVGKVEISIVNDGIERKIVGKYPKFSENKEELTFDITLTDNPKECMFIATPFDKPKHFYYNAKINCLTAKGNFCIGDKTVCVDGGMATLDWGRGVLTYDNTWYWGSMQTRLEDGSTFGFNIGYGFGDTSAASENMLFYRGLSHKIDRVTFHIPGDGTDSIDYLKPWRFTSSDGRLEMDFVPIVDRTAPLDLKFMCMLPHQVFGKFSGKAVLDDGKVIEFQDVLGFAEKVRNKW